MPSSPIPPSATDEGPAVDPLLLADCLRLQTGDRVEVRETHTSWVLLTRTRAYKLKRPVWLDFVDLRTRAARAESCRHELELNAELAPGIGIAVRSVLAGPGSSYRLGDDGDPGALDHVIEMHRFDESQTMRSLLERRELSVARAVATGERLAAFHRQAARARARVDERARFDRNVEALLALDDEALDARDLLTAQRFAGAFLEAWSDVIDARFAGGSVVDGHGDVRAEHVLLSDDEVRIVDRLDIDELRDVDIADELAFLVMDLDAREGHEFVSPVLHGYARGGGIAPPALLVSYFAAYRALVRAKVALLRGDGDGDGAGGRQAQRFVAQARRYAWRARGPMLLLVTGPPASGKSTLAAELHRLSGLEVLSSDVVRRARSAAEYDEAARASVYRDLAGRSGADESLIVDATFGEPLLQSAFFDGLRTRPERPVLVVECLAPAEVRMARAERRQRCEPTAPSDADGAVARVLGERFTGVSPSLVDGRLAVDTTVALADQVDEVEGWLDHRLAAGGLL